MKALKSRMEQQADLDLIKCRNGYAAVLRLHKDGSVMPCPWCQDLRVMLAPPESGGMKPNSRGSWRCAQCSAFRRSGGHLSKATLYRVLECYLIREIRRSGRLSSRGHKCLDEQERLLAQAGNEDKKKKPRWIVWTFARRLEIEIPDPSHFAEAEVLEIITRKTEAQKRPRRQRPKQDKLVSNAKAIVRA